MKMLLSERSKKRHRRWTKCGEKARATVMLQEGPKVATPSALTGWRKTGARGEVTQTRGGRGRGRASFTVRLAREGGATELAGQKAKQLKEKTGKANLLDYYLLMLAQNTTHSHYKSNNNNNI